MHVGDERVVCLEGRRFFFHLKMGVASIHIPIHI